MAIKWINESEEKKIKINFKELIGILRMYELNIQEENPKEILDFCKYWFDQYDKEHKI